jgi:Reverse transcriptase (RNA-dependent DNA polymerase)
MHTERFRHLRKDALSGILDKAAVSSVWRKIVRNQLRNLDIKDIFDHYDFNYNIEDRASTIRDDILNGTYKPVAPLIYRIEKKYGVCRHMVIPSPADALILQVLVESVAEQIIAKQPSANAFYSRDKHNVKKPHEGLEYGVPFREQWKQLQKKIYKFSEEKELLVVTDLSNYYDSISLPELRKVFLSHVKTNEVIVDLLFQIIEGISWTPDYLPYSGKGLPTANIEAIRLLAHSFLFEIDDVLKSKTKESFARWMDDITIGVDTRKEAVSIISSISDMLKSRGLALNLSKTAILDTKGAEHDFLIKKNLQLDALDNIDPNNDTNGTLEKRLIKQFKEHFDDQTPKHWDKVAKRYITAFSRLRSRRLLAKLPDIYLNYPGLRPNLLLYLSSLGYSKGTASAVLTILNALSVFDDISIVQIVNLLTNWEIPTTAKATEFLNEAEVAIRALSVAQKEPSGFYALLWFKTKYSAPKSLLRFIEKYDSLWKADAFLRRQATAVIARLLTLEDSRPRVLLTQQVSSGAMGTVSVANQIAFFECVDKLEPKVEMYLFPKNKQRIYPLGKFLVLCSLLNSQKIRNSQVIVKKIKETISDPYYTKWLNIQYEI